MKEWGIGFLVGVVCGDGQKPGHTRRPREAGPPTQLGPARGPPPVPCSRPPLPPGSPPSRAIGQAQHHRRQPLRCCTQINVHTAPTTTVCTAVAEFRTSILAHPGEPAGFLPNWVARTSIRPFIRGRSVVSSAFASTAAAVSCARPARYPAGMGLVL